MAAEVLLQKGWHLTAEGIEECRENGNKGPDAVIKAALDIDLRDIGDKFLPDDINRGKVDYVQGPCVLQIQKIRNISTPKENEESQGAPRLLKFTFTDGHQNCGAVEIESLDKISLNTPPGTKVQLLGTVQIEHGFLLLNNKNTRHLGGRVEKLVECWQLKRSLAKQSRNTAEIADGGPPPFVPFGQRIGQDRLPVNKRDNFKSLDVTKEKKEEDGEFEQQRQATIAEVLQTKQAKTFGGVGKQFVHDKDVAKITEMGFSVEEANCALKQNQGNVEVAINALLTRGVVGVGGGRGKGPQRAPPAQDRQDRQERTDRSERRDRSDKPDRFERPERSDTRQGGRGRKGPMNRESEGEEVQPTRPSGPATLFDFLETKMTITKDTKPETKGQSQTKPASSSSSSSRHDSHINHGNHGQSQATNQNKPHSQPASRQSDQRPQGQSFSQNRRQNLPPRLANKYNKDGDGSQGRNSQQRSQSSYSYNNRQNDTSSHAEWSNHGEQSRNSYGSRNNYGNNRKTDYGEQNSYGDRNSHRDRNNYGAGSDKNSYTDRNSYGEQRDRANRDRNHGNTYNNHGNSGNERLTQGQANSSSVQQPDFSNPPPPIISTFEVPRNTHYAPTSNNQYSYQTVEESYRPNVTSYNTSYDNSRGGQSGEWHPPGGAVHDTPPDWMAQTTYMQNNNERRPREWRRGDKCLARYSGDGQFYNAVIEALSREVPTCFVTFTEYGNSEEVPLVNIRPAQKYNRTDGNWQGAGASKPYMNQPMKPHHQPNMVIPQGMAYPPPIAGDESLFAANHISSMEFRRGGGGSSYQKRQDRAGSGRSPQQY